MDGFQPFNQSVYYLVFLIDIFNEHYLANL